VALIRIDLAEAEATSMQPLRFQIQFRRPKVSKQPRASCFIQDIDRFVWFRQNHHTYQDFMCVQHSRSWIPFIMD